MEEEMRKANSMMLDPGSIISLSSLSSVYLPINHTSSMCVFGNRGYERTLLVALSFFSVLGLYVILYPIHHSYAYFYKSV